MYKDPEKGALSSSGSGSDTEGPLHKAHAVDHHQHPTADKPSVAEYLRTRITTLKPPMEKAPNPLALLRMLNARQWSFFLVSFLAWVRIVC